MQIIRGSQLEFVPASHEDPKDPGVLKRVMATSSHFIEGKIQMLNWSRLPANKSFAPHYHEDMQEVFVMLNGSVEVTVGDMTSTLDGGDAILISPREIHQMKNICGEDVDYLVFGISTGKGGKTVNV